MSTETPRPSWSANPPRWGRADVLAILAWLGALVAFFWDAVTLKGALFYFDITEINYPYREFLATEMRSGRLSRWMPGLYNGLPLYAESQAGYWHPLKWLLYPWMSTWQAMNLDTIGSIALTGLATYGWLRRHVGPAGALAGASTFGLSGFVWAHLIHTSMNNALTSVPLAFWAIEVAWDSGRMRGLALGALAIACQVFAGHLQDTILTVGALAIVSLYRMSTARGWRLRASIGGFAATMVGLGVAISAVQWVPSKDLLDRSPRVGGLSWEQLTYGSWSPELLPTLVVREAYGTLPRDTDWLDGWYPYHEMNAYMGLIAMGLAILGARACRDRWAGSWVLLVGLGATFMLGRYTALFDLMNRVPVVGSSRIPVRYHLWVSLGVAALAAIGVDRLARADLGRVRLRGTLLTLGVMVGASVAIAVGRYVPVWTETRLWDNPEYRQHFGWLGRDLLVGVGRTAILSGLAWWIARKASAEIRAPRRARIAALLPMLILIDLLGSHWWDVPTIDPSYWTSPPESARRIAADPAAIRVVGVADRASAEPGFASRPVDFFRGRDSLGWSLPPVWGLRSSTGLTPIYPRRVLAFQDHARPLAARYNVEGVTHLVTPRPIPNFAGRAEPAGTAIVNYLPAALPRARLMGRVTYAESEVDAEQKLEAMGESIRDHLIVEDPDRPVPPDAAPMGTTRIEVDLPERVEVAVSNESNKPAYLVLADTFDPGWSCEVDGRAASIRPAYLAFRAVKVDPGPHRAIFRYEPAGFRQGLWITIAGLVGSIVAITWRRPVVQADPSHAPTTWPAPWPWGLAVLLLLIVVGSSIRWVDGKPSIHPRWDSSFHRFTWAAGIEAIQPMRSSIGR